MASISPMADAALELADKGWLVLPCWPTNTTIRPDRAKSPVGSLVPNGHTQASRNPHTIEGWWTRQPDAMIGVRVDPKLMVVDIDPRNGGSIDAVEDAVGCSITRTRTVWSGRGDGGMHLYYWAPVTDGPLTARMLSVGVDLKTSGYCIAPPSIHPVSGQPYRWDDQPIVDPPWPLVELLTPPVRAPSTMAKGKGRNGTGPAGLVAFVARQPWGNVNNGLHWAGCKAAESGWLDSTLAEELVAAAVTAGESERKARRTIESAEHSAMTA